MANNAGVNAAPILAKACTDLCDNLHNTDMNVITAKIKGQVGQSFAASPVVGDSVDSVSNIRFSSHNSPSNGYSV
jgi:hypothetical protein